MSKIAFSLGPLDFYWYGLIIAVSLLAGLLVSLVQVKLRKQSASVVIDLVLYGVPAAIVGARLLYIILNCPIYWENPEEAFYIWHGGLVGDGALLGFVVIVRWYARRHKLQFWQLLDIVAPGLALGLAIGQWGNFINQEGFGYPTTLPWGIYIDYAYRPFGYEQFDFYHPLFLYESAWNIFVFLVLQTIAFFRDHRQEAGQGRNFFLLLLLVSIGRFLVENARLEVDGGSSFYILQAINAVIAGISIWRIGVSSFTKKNVVTKNT